MTGVISWRPFDYLILAVRESHNHVMKPTTPQTTTISNIVTIHHCIAFCCRISSQSFTQLTFSMSGNTSYWFELVSSRLWLSGFELNMLVSVRIETVSTLVAFRMTLKCIRSLSYWHMQGSIKLSLPKTQRRFWGTQSGHIVYDFFSITAILLFQMMLWQ